VMVFCGTTFGKGGFGELFGRGWRVYFARLGGCCFCVGGVTVESLRGGWGRGGDMGGVAVVVFSSWGEWGSLQDCEFLAVEDGSWGDYLGVAVLLFVREGLGGLGF